MVVREEKQDGGRRSVSRRAEDVIGSFFFSGVVTLSNTIDNSVKDCHVQELPTGSVSVAYVD
jgi:hypothetical protein